MKISNENNPERSAEKSESKFNWSRFEFWKKTKSDVDENETFTSKREKEAKKRKNRILMSVILCLMVGGSLTSIAIPLLRNMNIAAEKDVPSSNLTNSTNDAAAKAILNGDIVKVADDGQTDKKISESDANKAIKDAVAAQVNADNEKLNKLTDELNTLKSVKEDAEALKTQVDELSKANKELTDSNKELSDSNKALSDENEKLKANMSATTNEEAYKKEISDLKEQLKTAQETIDQAKTTNQN